MGIVLGVVALIVGIINITSVVGVVLVLAGLILAAAALRTLPAIGDEFQEAASTLGRFSAVIGLLLVIMGVVLLIRLL